MEAFLAWTIFFFLVFLVALAINSGLKERISQEKLHTTAKEIKAREALEKRVREKEIEREKAIAEAKRTVSILEAAEIAKAALTKLRIKDLRELIPFLQTEEQLGSLIKDFHNELIPIYEDLMRKRGLRKDLIGDDKWKELLNYCLGFGEAAIRKLPELTLSDINFSEQNIRSSSNEREIKKVASWSEIKKRIDSDN